MRIRRVDALAREAHVVDACYAQNPAWGPSRAETMTGMYCDNQMRGELSMATPPLARCTLGGRGIGNRVRSMKSGTVDIIGGKAATGVVCDSSYPQYLEACCLEKRKQVDVFGIGKSLFPQDDYVDPSIGRRSVGPGTSSLGSAGESDKHSPSRLADRPGQLCVLTLTQ